MPDHLALILSAAHDSPEMARFLAGDWPRKRNFMVMASAPSAEAGKTLLRDLRRAAGD